MLRRSLFPLLLAACYSSHGSPDAADSVEDAGRDAAAVKPESAIDAAPAFDCAAACAADPPICQDDPGYGPGLRGMTCEESCRFGFLSRNGFCLDDEMIRLLECLQENPGACEHLDGTYGCADEIAESAICQ